MDFQYAERSLHQQLIEATKPLPLHPNAKNNATQALRKHYDDWYASMRDKGAPAPETLTLYSFYSHLSYVIRVNTPKPGKPAVATS